MVVTHHFKLQKLDIASRRQQQRRRQGLGFDYLSGCSPLISAHAPLLTRHKIPSPSRSGRSHFHPLPPRFPLTSPHAMQGRQGKWACAAVGVGERREDYCMWEEVRRKRWEEHGHKGIQVRGWWETRKEEGRGKGMVRMHNPWGIWIWLARAASMVFPSSREPSDYGWMGFAYPRVRDIDLWQRRQVVGRIIGARRLSPLRGPPEAGVQCAPLEKAQNAQKCNHIWERHHYHYYISAKRAWEYIGLPRQFPRITQAGRQARQVLRHACLRGIWVVMPEGIKLWAITSIAISVVLCFQHIGILAGHSPLLWISIKHATFSFIDFTLKHCHALSNAKSCHTHCIIYHTKATGLLSSKSSRVSHDYSI